MKNFSLIIFLLPIIFLYFGISCKRTPSKEPIKETVSDSSSKVETPTSKSTSFDMEKIEVKPANKWALIIGVSTYTKINGMNLNFTDDDAREFKDALVKYCYFPESNIKLLLDASQNTKSGIMQGIQWLSASAKQNDIVVIYFAGHGTYLKDKDGDEADGLDEYILPSDVGWNGLKGDKYDLINAISDDEFSNEIEKIKCDNIVIIFDSCHSGGALRATRLSEEYTERIVYFPGLKKDEQEKMKTDLINYVQSRASQTGTGNAISKQSTEVVVPNRFFIGSTQAGDVALEFARYKHGLFTYYLLKALKGEADLDTKSEVMVTIKTLTKDVVYEENIGNGDGKLSCMEIFKYVYKKMEEERHNSEDPEDPDSGIKQEPVLLNGINKDIILNSK